MFCPEGATVLMSVCVCVCGIGPSSAVPSRQTVCVFTVNTVASVRSALSSEASPAAGFTPRSTSRCAEQEKIVAHEGT